MFSVSKDEFLDRLRQFYRTLKMQRRSGCPTRGAHACDIYVLEERNPEDFRLLQYLKRRLQEQNDSIEYPSWIDIKDTPDVSLTFIVASEGDLQYETNLCGWMQLERIDRDMYKLDLISTRASYDPEYRGTGSCLMEEMERYIVSNGGKFVILHASWQAEDFYKKLGYGSVTFGKGISFLAMYKALDPIFEVVALKEARNFCVSYFYFYKTVALSPPVQGCQHEVLMVDPEEKRLIDYLIRNHPILAPEYSFGTSIIVSDYDIRQGGTVLGWLSFEIDEDVDFPIILYMKAVDQEAYICLIQRLEEEALSKGYPMIWTDDDEYRSVLEPLGYILYEIKEKIEIQGKPVINIKHHSFLYKPLIDDSRKISSIINIEGWKILKDSTKFVKAIANL